MTLNVKEQIAILSVIAVVSFGIGRFLAPTKVKTETKIVQTKVTDEAKEAKKKVHKVTTIHKDADGKSVTTITEDDNIDSSDEKHAKTDTSVDKTKEVTRESSSINISALAVRDPQTGLITYGAQVQKDILGPINVGLMGLTNGIVGVSLGVRF